MSAIYIGTGPIDYTPAENVSMGDVIELGGLVGVAKRDIAAGTLGALDIGQLPQYKIDLASGKTFDAGEAVYVDDSEATDSGTQFGWATADSDATTGTVNAVLIPAPASDES